MIPRIGLGCFALVCALAANSGSSARQNVRIRGVVRSLSDQTLVVTTRESPDATIKLADNWSVGGLRAASLEDMKAGFVHRDGGDAAGRRYIEGAGSADFPARSFAERGSFPVDLLPESTMTNATVAETVQGVSGRNLKLVYKGGEKLVMVPPEAPVVTFAPAEKSDIKPGAPVFVGAQRQTDGSMTATRVTVGNNGVAPPM